MGMLVNLLKLNRNDIRCNKKSIFMFNKLNVILLCIFCIKFVWLFYYVFGEVIFNKIGCVFVILCIEI